MAGKTTPTRCFHPGRFGIALLAQLAFCLVAAPILAAEQWATHVPIGHRADTPHPRDSRVTLQAALDAGNIRPEEDSDAGRRRGKQRAGGGVLRALGSRFWSPGPARREKRAEFAARERAGVGVLFAGEEKKALTPTLSRRTGRGSEREAPESSATSAPSLTLAIALKPRRSLARSDRFATKSFLEALAAHRPTGPPTAC